MLSASTTQHFRLEFKSGFCRTSDSPKRKWVLCGGGTERVGRGLPLPMGAMPSNVRAMSREKTLENVVHNVAHGFYIEVHLRLQHQHEKEQQQRSALEEFCALDISPRGGLQDKITE